MQFRYNLRCNLAAQMQPGFDLVPPRCRCLHLHPSAIISIRQAEVEEAVAPVTVPTELSTVPVTPIKFPPIRDRATPSPRHSSNPMVQPTSSHQLPPIGNVPGPHFEVAEKTTAPPNPGMIPNPNKPEHWSQMNEVQKDNWNRRNTIPEPDWTTMSPNQRKKWYRSK